ncbi:hypothetical protein MMC10_006956 [Thelotrema lepadinum]|nr:hypothetical protein [Thelotrema lepadinum]
MSTVILAMASGVTESSTSFPFLRLPKEIRLQVLRHSDLVDSRFGSPFQQQLVYKHGRLKIRSHHADTSEHTSQGSCDFCPYILSGSLLRVNKQLRNEAFEIMITHNLLILNSGHTRNLEFLQALPTVTRNRIRHLDLKFNHGVDFAGEQDSECCFLSNFPDFDRLIGYISDHLSLSQLHLSLDLLEPWWGIVLNNPCTTPIQAALWLRAIKRISQPLHTLHKLKQFHVFLPVHSNYEYIMEQAALGPDYDSRNDGKVPLQAREHNACHAYPLEEEEDGEAEGWEDAAIILTNESPYESVEDYTKSCSHPEWFIGIPVPPLPSTPGEVLELRRCWRVSLWYGQSSRNDALKISEAEPVTTECSQWSTNKCPKHARQRRNTI